MRIANGGEVPTVLDPFAGGGAIPLEASRLGCQAIANDYNPVAYLILRAACEFPQKYGKKLAQDVEHWAKWILERAKEKIGHLYPPGKDGKPVVGYLWARTAPCSNPACRAEIPLLRSLLVCNKEGKRVALTMTTRGKEVSFGIAKGREIRETEGTMLERGDCRCPICKQVTPVADLRHSGCEGKLGERMVAVITDTPNGKDYRPVESSDMKALEIAQELSQKMERPSEPIRPEVTQSEGRVANRGDITVHLYGMKTWGSLFNPRQLVAMQTFVGSLREALALMRSEISDPDYRNVVGIYLGLWLSRNSMRMSSIGRWDVGGEKFQTPFDGARMPMKWDYVEANPFTDVTGGFGNQLDWILHFLAREGVAEKPSAQVLRGDGACINVASGAADVTITDPPYFDEAAYADLSDFFYVWLKRAIGDVVPEFAATPLTPKSDEATALRHRHNGDAQAAELHFTTKLNQVFTEAKRATRADGIHAGVVAPPEALFQNGKGTAPRDCRFCVADQIRTYPVRHCRSMLVGLS